MLQSSTPTDTTSNMDFIDSYDNTQSNHRESLTLASLLSMDVTSVPKVAKVTEWLDLIYESERRTGISLLTNEQKDAIRQFDTELVDETFQLSVADFLSLIQRLAHCGPDEYMSSEASSVMQPFNSPATPPSHVEYRSTPYLEPPTTTNPTITRSRSLTPRIQSTSSSPRPKASSSLDHRQRTNQLLNQVQQRLQRNDRHRDEHDSNPHDDDDDDEDDGRVTPSTDHPSVSAVSSLDEFDDHIPPKHHPIVTLEGSKGKARQEAYFTYNYDSDLRPTTSLSRYHNEEDIRRRWQDAERRLESLTKSYDERMGQMEVELGDMRHETIMYKATIRDYQASDKENKIRIEELEKAIESANSKGSTQRQTIEDLHNELKHYTDQTEELKERLSAKEKELSHHVKKYEQLRSDMEELERAQEELSQLRAELSRQYLEVEEQRTRSKNLEAENENLKENIDLLKTELDESRPTGDLYGLKPLQTLDAELAGTIPVNSTMQSKLEKLANERDEYKAQVSKERNHANELYQQVDSLARERDEYEREALAALEESKKASQKYQYLHEENQRLKEQMSQLQDKRRSMRNKIVPASDAGAQCDLVSSSSSEATRRLSVQLQEQEATIKRLMELDHEKDLELKRSKQVNFTQSLLVLASLILFIIITEAVIDWLATPSTLGIEHTNYYSSKPGDQVPATGIRKWMVEMLDFGDDMSFVVQ